MLDHAAVFGLRTMDLDVKMKRGSFIGYSLKVRDAFWFAASTQVLGAVKVFTYNLFGGMLWRLYSQPALPVTRSWHTCVK